MEKVPVGYIYVLTPHIAEKELLGLLKLVLTAAAPEWLH